MKIRNLLPTEIPEKDKIIEYVVKLYDLHEKLKTIKGGPATAGIIQTRTKMHRLCDRLRVPIAEVFGPILHMSGNAYWLTQKKHEHATMDLGDMVDADSEEGVALQKKLLAIREKASSKFVLQVAVEGDLPEDIEDYLSRAVDTFKELFGESTQVEHKISGSEVNFYVTIKIKNLK